MKKIWNSLNKSKLILHVWILRCIMIHCIKNQQYLSNRSKSMGSKFKVQMEPCVILMFVNNIFWILQLLHPAWYHQAVNQICVSRYNITGFCVFFNVVLVKYDKNQVMVSELIKIYVILYNFHEPYVIIVFVFFVFYSFCHLDLNHDSMVIKMSQGICGHNFVSTSFSMLDPNCTPQI